VVARQYVADYISVAGTFPCAADLASIADPNQFANFAANADLVLSGTGARCTVHRALASIPLGLRGQAVQL
jgi:hypothetical protein